ncbi:MULTISPECIES: methyltransferase domain-containing protein [unclassified Streptomyces]|uniref:class I SAM-dependent methyltransferase n=1 Tax=unclassified Streptomyces TaxID=2593676 RepID=UPI002DDB6110|nr:MULTISPECIES: methyltransferase domain-containing protein [unclassified Streptomyces]WSB75605.1 methyltransferase domain-containing protein [Streptomyces sp. NBC_01775]WSS16110.1 methyltransferase domain-containing protein [Streptomyces sp. NBC_01186]WSS44929.1 methyltransferase domain-containing protein [Streptomyces sp. NBC_01187]
MPDVVNIEQAQAWNGPEGTHWARNQDRWNAVNEGFNEPLLDAAGITGDHRVLDLGCGSGQTTRLAALRAPRGHALGLDLSGPMLAEARAHAEREGITNASFTQGDAQVYPFEAGAFDAAMSRYGVMFFADPVAAFGNVGRTLRPGGRLAFVCPADAALNGWVAAMATLHDFLPAGDFGRPGLPGMFSLAAPDHIRAVLAAAGFTSVTVDQAQAYGTWGHGAEDAAEFLLGTGPGRHLMEQADATARVRARRTLTEHLRAHEAADGTVRLRSTSWLVTADRPAGPAGQSG